MTESDLKQAVAYASKPFLESVSETLGHGLSAGERVELCGELEQFMAATTILVREIPAKGRNGHEVVREALGLTAPALAETILEKAGDAPDGAWEALIRHITVFFTLAALCLSMAGQGERNEEE